MENKTSHVVIRLAPSTKAAAIAAATKDRRSLSAWVEKLIADALPKKKDAS